MYVVQSMIMYGAFDIAINFKVKSVPHKKQKMYYNLKLKILLTLCGSVNYDSQESHLLFLYTMLNGACW
jgi:hypothetical protein